MCSADVYQRWGGQPFNRPTHAGVSPNTGDIFVTDGYGNSRVHKFSADGRLLLSWGEPGIDAGQFMRPHNIAVGPDDRVYVADRECHRVQVLSSGDVLVNCQPEIRISDSVLFHRSPLPYHLSILHPTFKANRASTAPETKTFVTKNNCQYPRRQ
mgnify:CR=1 FL=1